MANAVTIVAKLTSAQRIAPRLTPKASNPAAALGLRYERHVRDALGVWAKANDAKVEHNPWFSYIDKNGYGVCVPDLLLIFDDQVIVIEVKLTYVHEAITKLNGLYLPVVAKATGLKPLPLVIVKNLTLGSPQARDRLSAAICMTPPLMQYLGHSRIIW